MTEDSAASERNPYAVPMNRFLSEGGGGELETEAYTVEPAQDSPAAAPTGDGADGDGD